MERSNSLRTKSILAEVSPDDGYRISVMSRHTLSDGITLNEKITDDLFDEWMKVLAPPLKLVGSYYKNEINWNQFETGYNVFLALPETQKHIRMLFQRIEQNGIVTIMCIEDTPEQCHRRLLAEECHRLDPELEVVIS